MNFLEIIFFKIKWFLFSFWWLLFPLIAFYLFWIFFTQYSKEKFLKSLDWVLLEIKVSQETLKTPKVMEQVFTNLHSSLRRKISFFERNFKGIIQEWFSFEIVSISGEIRFFIRTPSKFRNLIESQIYAQYPEAEINLVEDYFKRIKEKFSFKEYDFEDALLILARENPYPILTYQFFEEKEEEKRIDPLANILEAMITDVNKDQTIILQYLFRPIKDDWKKEGEEIVKGLAGGKPPVKMNIVEHTIEWIRNFCRALFEPPIWSGGGAGEPPEYSKLSPGVIEIIKSIERKISKLGFEGAIRISYLSKKETFDKSKTKAVIGAFFQFNTQNLNAFKKENPLEIKFEWFFKNRRMLLKKKEEFLATQKRKFPSKTSIFNSEELATIYHFPTKMVKTPSLIRPPIKQIEPPSTLPT